MLILPACWASRSPSPGRVWRPPTLPTSSEACIRPLCSQYLAIGWPWQHSLWAISFSWCGKTRSRPPPWMSKVRPSRRRLMAEHSMCQPGRPGPQGLGHEGSPGLAPFHRAKSAALRFRSAMPPPSPCIDSSVAVAELAVVRVLAHVEVDVAVGAIGEALVDQPLGEVDDLVDVLGAAGEVVDRVDAQGLDVPHVVGGHLGGQVGHGHVAGVGLGDQLVVHVGDVDHQGHFVAAVDQVAFDGVEDDRPDHVADVAGLIDGRPAEIDADLAGLDGLEGFFGLREGVVDADHGGGEGLGIGD